MADDCLIAELVESGATLREISEETGLTVQEINARIKELDLEASRFNTPPGAGLAVEESEVLEALSKHAPKDVEAQMKSLAPFAVKSIARVALYGAKDGDRISASKEILHEAGFKPAERVNHFHDLNKMTKKELVAELGSELERLPLALKQGPDGVYVVEAGDDGGVQEAVAAEDREEARAEEG